MKKMAVNLQKGQKISLDKEAGSALTKVVMGLGWDVAKKKGFFGFGGGSAEIDLDTSCLMFDEAGQMVDIVWFRQLQSKDGSIKHSGDNRTGAGEGDDEQIMVDLSRVPANVKSLVFTVNSFTGQTFLRSKMLIAVLLMAVITKKLRVITCRVKVSIRHKLWPKSISTMASGKCTPLVKMGQVVPLSN
jgi:stress response protein SCP2